jgi:arginase
MNKKIQIIEVKSEIGAGTRGASMGIDAIKVAAHNSDSRLFIDVDCVEIPNLNHLLYAVPLNKHAKRLGGILTMYEQVAESVAGAIKSNIFPIVLAGDHSTAGGTIAGIKIARPNLKLGVVWIDAHADMHSPYTTPSGNVHGMPLAASLGEDNIDKQKNNPDADTIGLWNKLKDVGKINPKISYNNLVFISVRDVEQEEQFLIDSHNIKTISAQDVHAKGVENTVNDTLSFLKDCDLIYVSFDVDSMDSSISKGTGTPVENGITKKEAEGLCNMLVLDDKVCCFEIAEVNPTLDSNNTMAKNAFDILDGVINSTKQ